MKNLMLLMLLVCVVTVHGQVEKFNFETPFRLKADGKIIDVKQLGHSAPLIYDYNKDGKDDLIVGYYGIDRVDYDSIRVVHPLTKGGGQIYLNKGTNKQPEYTYAGNLMGGGELVYVPTDCCNGLTPRMADLNGDGIDDLVSGSYPGQAYLWKGIGEGMFGAREYLRDVNGNVLNPGHSNSVVPFDWDDDGDLDLVWGIRIDKTGIALSINEGDKKNPKFSAPKKIRSAEKRTLVKSSNTAPIDWDGDGLFDLVCGTEGGAIIWYKNIGVKGKPNFTGAPEILIANNFNRNTLIGELNPKPHGYRTKIFPFDYNRDGKLDILVGDFYSFKGKQLEISAEDKIKVDAISKANFELDMKYYESDFYKLLDEKAKILLEENPDLTHTEVSGMVYGLLPPEVLQEYLENEETKKLRYKKITDIQGEYVSTYSGFVWVYLQK